MISQRVNYILNYFKIALFNINSNKAGNLFALAIMSFSFFIILFFLLFYVNAYSYMKIFQKSDTMVIFLKNKTNPAEVENFLNSIKGIKSIKFYNKKQSLDFLEKKVKNIKSALKNINTDYLPSFIRINFKKNYLNEIYLSNVYLRLKLNNGIKYIYYNKILENKILQFMFFTKVVGLVIFIFLFMLASFISYSAIKLVILRKQNEIEILKLIGATNGYIRIPMFIETLMGAVTAFIIALCLLFLIFKIFIYYHFNDFLNYFNISVIFLNLEEILLVLAAGLLSALVGAYLSSRKFFYEPEE